MKKVILNGVITDLDGKIVSARSGHALNAETGEYEDVTVPVRFGTVVYTRLINSRTKTDEDAKMLFELARKVNVSLDKTEVDTLELTDDEYAAVKKCIDSEALVVKARFLEMVEAQNSKAEAATDGVG